MPYADPTPAAPEPVAGPCVSPRARAGSHPTTAPARAALYTADGSTLMTCARHAESAGLRVVTMIDEEQPGVGLAGAELDALVDRLGDGEFEVIVADAGDGRVVTIAAAPIDAALTDGAGAENAGVAVTTSDEEAAPIPAIGASSRCAIYVRCASRSQATPYPLADQWDACEAYAAKQGWETVAVYKDNATGGKKWSRASLNSMMSEAARGAFDVVLVRDLDRLCRDASQLHRLLVELKALGVAVHTVNGGERAAWEASVWRFMVMRSIKEATAMKSLGSDHKLRPSRAPTTNKQVEL